MLIVLSASMRSRNKMMRFLFKLLLCLLLAVGTGFGLLMLRSGDPPIRFLNGLARALSATRPVDSIAA